MTITVKDLVEQIRPSNCVLVLGAGASIPSGAPSAAQLSRKIGEHFRVDSTGLTLSEVAGLVEAKQSRADLIDFVRLQFKHLKAKGAILNLPQYEWKSIFSTNYDHLIEDSYAKAGRPLKVFSSNFDFTVHADPNAAKLFKIHGTLEKDISDGHSSKMILTDADYDNTEDYREALFDRMRSDISPGSSVIIVGQSLGDRDLRDLVQRAIQINQKAQNQGRISLLLYERDDNRAQLFEQRGLRVAFGGLDDFALELTKRRPDHLPLQKGTGSHLDHATELRPVTRDVSEELDPARANVSGIFNGWPADYADISKGYTFDRRIVSDVVTYLLGDSAIAAVILGASGVGKTTAARQAMLQLRSKGLTAWEHKSDYPLVSRSWISVGKRLKDSDQLGALFVDEAHSHLYEINDLLDLLAAEKCTSLKVILVSTRNHWSPESRRRRFIPPERSSHFLK